MYVKDPKIIYAALQSLNIGHVVASIQMKRGTEAKRFEWHCIAS